MAVRLIPVAVAAAGAALAGCSSTTYGTGISPGKQTLEDVVGIVSMSGKAQQPIDYSPRPPIVTPPKAAAETLPPPGTTKVASLPADWPQDPDVIAQQRKKAEETRVIDWNAQGANSKNPDFRLPKQPVRPWTPMTDKSAGQDALPTPQEIARSKKMFADMRSMRNGSVDANGNPVRRYLIEPPSTYRVPDPTEPVEITDKPKKASGPKWPWQWFK